MKPLDMLRILRDDTQLTTAQFAILVAAVLRTDNRNGRVRASQEMLAEDARVTDRTVRNFYRSEAFARYFKSERVGRRLLLTWSDTGTDTGNNTGNSFRPSAICSSASTETHGSEGGLGDIAPVEPLASNFCTKDEYLEAHMNWQIDYLDWKMAQDH